MLQMQSAKFSWDRAYLDVRRHDEKIETTPQKEYFQRN